jgi:hypothetical protein
MMQSPCQTLFHDDLAKGFWARQSSEGGSPGLLNPFGCIPAACRDFVIPANAGIQKKKDWMPDQVRHDGIRPMHRSSLRSSSFTWIPVFRGMTEKSVFALKNKDKLKFILHQKPSINL